MDFPETSRTHYITGITALNIPSDEGTGDWHILDTLGNPQRFQLAGLNFLSTHEVFGDEGIFECAQVLEKYGAFGVPKDCPVYAANHYRAVADMIWNALEKKWQWHGAIIADDWFPAPEDKKKLRDILTRGLPSLTPEQRASVEAWMQREQL